ncbi:MAG TPA: PAS domain-containing protein [Steroidobacteraceae bacterium]
MRPSADSTQLIPRPVWENPRVHLLDDVWLMTIVAILLATGIPWFASGFQVAIGRASWGLLALGGVHIAFTLLAAPTRPHGPWRDRTLTLLDVAGVVLIGYIWQHVGALQNPLFLTVFALPVIGAIFLSRWHPYLIAVISILVVTIVALSQAPELRWYASGIFGSEVWLNWLFGPQSAVAQPSFSGFYAPSSYLIVLLEVFAILLLACAVAAEYVGTIFERLNAHIVMARTEAERGQELWASLIERLPLPAILVDPDTLRIVASSEQASSYLRSGEMPLEGRSLFEALQFSYPDIVQELIVGSDGGAPLTVIRIADQLHVTQARVLHIAHKGRRLALLTVEDATEVFCLKAVLDTSEYAALVIDARGRVLTFNKPAVGLFGSAEEGMDAAQLLPQPDGGLPWWEPGLTGRRKMHIEIGPRIYQVTSSAVALAGEEERIFTVTFLPVARAGTTDPFATSSTMVTSTLGQLR